MTTNLEKWNYCLDLLNEKANQYMDSLNPLIPDKFWKVNPNGSIKECFVQNRHYNFGLYFNGKKPTNKDIEKIRIVFESKIEFDSEKAYFDYKYYWGIHQGKKSYASTSIKLIHLIMNKNKNVFLTLSGAELIAKDLIIANNEKKEFQDKHKKDKYYNYPENGYKFLGWQNGWKHVYFDEDGNECSKTGKPSKTFGYLANDYPEYGKCIDLKHKRIEVSHNQRGSEHTVSCPICKVYWKYDSSD